MLSEPFDNFLAVVAPFHLISGYECCDGFKRTLIIVVCRYEELHIYLRGQKLGVFLLMFEGPLFSYL